VSSGLGENALKVLLKKDVPTLGKAGEVKDVADGYGRNYLIPRGLASAATKTAVTNVEAHKASAAKQSARVTAENQALAETITATPLRLQARTGEQGRLYGSVTTADIADALSKVVGRTIDKRDVEIEDPIRTLGSHSAKVHVAPRITASLTVVVQPED
jgi:large subunit ribosomal protein L9